MVIYTIRARNPRIQFLQLNETEHLSEEVKKQPPNLTAGEFNRSE